MAKLIQKIHLRNFKRFEELEVDFNDDLNILIGDNETGKSTILSAIDLVLSGSINKVTSLGLDNLINLKAKQDFLAGERDVADLPILEVDLYLKSQDGEQLGDQFNGNNNISRLTADGIRLVCEPNHESYSLEIKDALEEDPKSLPYEYYSVKFFYFSGEIYSPYRKGLQHLLIDTAMVGTERATRSFTKSVYELHIEDAKESARLQNLYRGSKENFASEHLTDLNERVERYNFGLKTSTKTNLETDLMIYEEDISIDNRGRGKQSFIKAEFALSCSEQAKKCEVVIIEEPESHLSHTQMNALVDVIKAACDAQGAQLFIATHSNMISARLGLQKCIFLGQNASQPLFLKDVEKSTADFFSKAPVTGILDFILASKVLLVEGAAEYILLESMYRKVTGREPKEDGVFIASVGGISFKRYMELANCLGIKLAVVRDNDGDYQKNCVDNYVDYASDTISVFSEQDNNVDTFEKSIFEINQDLCKEVLERDDAENWMLQNKADAAFKILESGKDIEIPGYIQEAVQWISA